MERLRRDLAYERVHVRIGEEIQLPGCEACSYVIAPFAIDGHVLGGVGVLGPKRMDYPRMSGWVDAIARATTEVLSHGGRI
jgi:heat-inducible transcriptional repressor